MTNPNFKAYTIIAVGVIAGASLVTALTINTKPRIAKPRSVIAAPARVEGDRENIEGLRSLDLSYSNLAEYVLPAVVQIRNEGNRSADESGKRMPTQGGEGSGFVYRDDGYVITNDHVVSGAKEVKVILNDGREYTGTVVSAPEWDVAVVKIKADKLPVLNLADSKVVKPGQMVMAIGSPYGLENSVTFGNVSAIGRVNEVPDMMMQSRGRFYPDLIQTDAAINVGNSGGPLVNIDGQVIGMNSSIFTRDGGSNGIGFAIPSNQVRLLADILISKGRVTRSMLGVFPRDLRPYEVKENGGQKGAYVETVEPKSPADKAGLKKGDLITQIGSDDISSQIDLRNAMITNAPGSTVSINYLRGGNTGSVKVKLEESKEITAPRANQRQFRMNPNEFGDLFGEGQTPNIDELRKRFQNRSQDPSSGDDRDVEPLRSDAKPKLGIGIENLNDDIRKKFNIPASIQGVVIMSVEPSSLAARADYQVGDVIEEIAGKKLANANELMTEMSAVSKGDRRKFKVTRFSSNSRITSEKEIEFK
jgi:serine protease Do